MSNHEDVTIRRATVADLAQIVALLADDEIGVGRESPDDLTPYQHAFDAIESDKYELLVVPARDGQVVGTLQLSLLPGLSRKGAFRAQIEGVRVSRGERAEHSERTSWNGPSARRAAGVASWSNSRRTRHALMRSFSERIGFTATHEGFTLTL